MMTSFAVLCSIDSLDRRSHQGVSNPYDSHGIVGTLTMPQPLRGLTPENGHTTTFHGDHPIFRYCLHARRRVPQLVLSATRGTTEQLDLRVYILFHLVAPDRPCSDPDRSWQAQSQGGQPRRSGHPIK
jgi:hypothetical protein